MALYESAVLAAVAAYEAGLGVEIGKGHQMVAYEVPNGLIVKKNWRPVKDEPLVVAPKNDQAFDSPVGGFWDPLQQRYAFYVRGWHPPGVSGRIRAIRMYSSRTIRS